MLTEVAYIDRQLRFQLLMDVFRGLVTSYFAVLLRGRHWHSAQFEVSIRERERGGVDLRGLGLQLYDNEATDRTTRLYGEFE